MTGLPPLLTTTPAFVGRAEELGTLCRAIDAARGGTGSAFLVVGEAGIGKTRLVTEAAGHARESGVQVLWASGFDPGGAPSYWHWVQVLRALASKRDRQSLVRDLGPEAPEVSRLVPDIRTGVQLASPGEPQGDDARFRMYDAVASFLKRASRRRPLLVVLDDIHTADSGTITLLRYVIAEIGHSHIAILGTAREPATDSNSPAVAAALAGLCRHLVTLSLQGLGRGDVGIMLENLVGADNAARLAPEIYRRGAGNPLFVGELALLFAGSPTSGERPQLPASIRAVLEQRVVALPAGSLDVLRTAAVIGDEFDVGLLSEVAGTTRTEVLEALDQAFRTRLVVDRRPSRPEFSFAHALIRELLYEQLALPRRAALHRRIGEALERGPAADPPLAQLAHHFLAGAAAVADGKAAEYSERAGQHAAGQLAYEDAARHFQAALEASEGERQHRIQLLLALGEAKLRGGDLPGAREAFMRAAELARADERYDLLAEAALGLGSGLDGFEVRLFDHAQITLLEEALDRLGEQPTPLRAWVLARLSVALTFAAPPPRRLQLANEAVQMARRLDEPRALAYALAARCDATAGPEHIDERREAADEIVRLAHTAGDRGMELLGRRNRLIALLESGNIPGVDAEIEGYEMVARALRQPLYQWYVPLWRGMRALMDGRLDASRRHGREAAAIGEKARSRNAALNVEVLEWNTLLKEGRFREAGDVLARQLELADGIYGEPFWVPLIASQAYPTEAQAALDRLAANDFNELPRDAIWLAAMTYAADACGVVRHSDAAELLYELILPYRSRFAVDAIGAACYGSMSRALGVLATVLGRRSEAERHFEEAMEAHRSCGAIALVAETLHHNGDALTAFGEATRGDSLRAEARSLYRSLGMAPRADLIAHATATTGPAVEPVHGNLLRREGDYWTISYGGRTIRAADSKGLRDIAMLISHAGRQLHVADLIAASDPSGGSLDERSRDALLRTSGSGDPVLDEPARDAYRARLFELRDELEEAEAHSDIGRAEAARVEMDMIAGELASALGLGGRPRVQTDANERARKAVTQRIRNTLKRLATVHPELSRHLERAVRTGRFCTYSPETPTRWSL